MIRSRLSGAMSVIGCPVATSLTLALAAAPSTVTTRPSVVLRSRSLPSACRIAAARTSPLLPSAVTAFSFAAKLSPASPARTAAKSSACAGAAAIKKINASQTRRGKRNIREVPTHPSPIPLLLRRRGMGEGPYTTSIREFGGDAVAADPGIAPVGDLALILRQIRAPRIRLDGLLGLPHDIELTVGLDLADHDRL